MTTRPHGYARYRLDKCRCKICRDACAAYRRRVTMATIAGTWQPFVDSEPVREHLLKLVAAGVGERRIHEQTGVSRSAITNVLRGRRGKGPGDKCRRETAEAILAVDVSTAQCAPGTVIDGTGTARRVQALCCMGWTLTEQARRVGSTPNNYHSLIYGDPVKAATARLISRLYDELAMVPAPSGRASQYARRYAAKRGWVPPLAWDDDTIDTPAAAPAGAGWTKRRSSEDLVADYNLLRSEGHTTQQIADRLGMHPDTLHHHIIRARKTGLLEERAA